MMTFTPQSYYSKGWNITKSQYHPDTWVFTEAGGLGWFSITAGDRYMADTYG